MSLFPSIKPLKSVIILLGIILVLVIIAGTFNVSSKTERYSNSESSAAKTISSFNELETILKSSSDQILIFDFYADWCMPCHILSPVLEEIASEYSSKAVLYKINVDANPDIANALGVSGIPFVIVVYEGAVISALSGVQPKENYLEVINSIDSKKISGSK